MKQAEDFWPKRSAPPFLLEAPIAGAVVATLLYHHVLLENDHHG
jgi:hypothetical protein